MCICALECCSLLHPLWQGHAFGHFGFLFRIIGSCPLWQRLLIKKNNYLLNNRTITLYLHSIAVYIQTFHQTCIAMVSKFPVGCCKLSYISKLSIVLTFIAGNIQHKNPLQAVAQRQRIPPPFSKSKPLFERSSQPYILRADHSFASSNHSL